MQWAHLHQIRDFASLRVPSRISSVTAFAHATKHRIHKQTTPIGIAMTPFAHL